MPSVKVRQNVSWISVFQKRLLMNSSTHSDPAERGALMRLLYRNWRPTRLGGWINRLNCWWSGLGLPPKFQAVLEVYGRKSRRK